jgi:hypothetical protein
MDHRPSHRSCGRSVLGEALIVITVIAGFFWATATGALPVQNLWTYAGVLVAIVLFYFALLICRIAFYHATGGNGEFPWWAYTPEMQKKMFEEHSKKK